jgi:hypothetical protein
MIIRAIAPGWLLEDLPGLKKVHEGQFSLDEIKKLNEQGYNIYYFPNYPSLYQGGNVSGCQIDIFKWVFVDFDLKSNTYNSKDDFIASLANFPYIPTKIVDSGNGIHVYWRVNNLDAMSYLKLQKRLIRQLHTDEAVCTISQLMRLENTYNTKIKDNFKFCELIFEDDNSYECEEISKGLPAILQKDDKDCISHFNKTYNPNETTEVEDKIPLKFADLLRDNHEAQAIWKGGLTDRSTGDFRLGHIMLASGFTRDEALSVLVNSAKALGRSTEHRVSYAENIADKIWTVEPIKTLSLSVKEILQKSGSTIKGTRFPCWSYIDNTENGFRLGQVIGLVAGSGVGKTAVALNLFRGFVQYNPDYIHFFVPLEQPAREIADRWQTMCGDNSNLHEKVHIISNYDDDGTFRDLSLETIKQYILNFQASTGKKVGTVVIDHIGVLSNNDKFGQDEGVKKLCKEMKAFAAQTNTMLIMQSQTSREKAGIGDLELNKDAAFGTSVFENFCDYLITIWQPLKRMYKEGAPTITAFKFCKIRHKKQHKDVIKEDICYKLVFDPSNEHLRELKETEETSFKFYLAKCTNKRKNDRKTELVDYESVKVEGVSNGKTNNNSEQPGIIATT